MKADLYVQGRFWASIVIPGDSFLALLAKGLITEAQTKAEQLRQDLDSLDGVTCSISIRHYQPVTCAPPNADQDPHEAGP